MVLDAAVDLGSLCQRDDRILKQGGQEVALNCQRPCECNYHNEQQDQMKIKGLDLGGSGQWLIDNVSRSEINGQPTRMLLKSYDQKIKKERTKDWLQWKDVMIT